MSPMTARALSMALLGGVAAALLPSVGLLTWAGFLAWGVFIAAGEDNTAFTKTIAGGIFGAFLAWAALMVTDQINIPTDSWLWMPRAGIAVAVTLYVLNLATKVDLLSYLPAGLIGNAAVFGTFAIPYLDLNVEQRITGLHLYNPSIQVALSMVAGALVGLISVKLAGALSKK